MVQHSNSDWHLNYWTHSFYTEILTNPTDFPSSATNRSHFSLTHWNISTFTRWIVVKLQTDVNGSQTMNPNDWSPSLFLTFVIFNETSPQLLAGLPFNRLMMNYKSLHLFLQYFGFWLNILIFLDGIPISLSCTRYLNEREITNLAGKTYVLALGMSNFWVWDLKHEGI